MKGGFSLNLEVKHKTTDNDRYVSITKLYIQYITHVPEYKKTYGL